MGGATDTWGGAAATAGGAGTGAGGRGGAGGVTILGGVMITGGGPIGVGAGGLGACTGTTGFASGAGGGAAGRAAGAGGGTACCCCLPIIAFSTSPGFEMCERSILVLISSGAEVAEREVLDAPCPSLEPRKCLRTFSASWSSSELEWVFFSVTPTSGNTSRMALLFTSSSLARSLIRILLIRLFVPPHVPR